MQGEAGMLRRQLGEAEGEVQVLLSQLAVQSKLAIASSKELTQLHDIIRGRDNQHRLVHALYCQNSDTTLARVTSTDGRS